MKIKNTYFYKVGDIMGALKQKCLSTTSYNEDFYFLMNHLELDPNHHEIREYGKKHRKKLIIQKYFYLFLHIKI